MRVVVVTGTLAPSFLTVWEACRQQGTDVRVVGTTFTSYGGLFRPLEQPGTWVTVLSPIVRTRRGHLWWWYRGLGDVLEGLRPDLVHVAIEAWGLPCVQVLAYRGRRARPKVTAHGCETLPGHGVWLERRLRLEVLKRALRRLDGFVGWSRLAVEAMRRAGLPQDVPAAAVPAVLPDPDTFHPPSEVEATSARARFGLPPAGLAVGFIGRLVPEKGVDDLVAVAKQVADPDITFAVWGAGPLAPSLQSRLGDAGRYMGALAHSDVPSALQACDVVVMPSRRTPTWEEQFGRVAVEAMMCGRPVVAYATGALPDVVGDAGVLVREGDVEGLAQAVRQLADSSTRRAQLEAAALRRARSRFSPEAAARTLLRFWQEVLAR